MQREVLGRPWRWGQLGGKGKGDTVSAHCINNKPNSCAAAGGGVLQGSEMDLATLTPTPRGEERQSERGLGGKPASLGCDLATVIWAM